MWRPPLASSLHLPLRAARPPALAPGVDYLKSWSVLPASLTAAGANMIINTNADCRYDNLRSGTLADQLNFT